MKKIILLIGLCVAVFSGAKAIGTAHYNVIPKPRVMVLPDASPFTLKATTRISYPDGDADLQRVAGMLSDYINQSCGLQLSVTTDKRGGHLIKLRRDTKSLPAEGYRMTVESSGITISGGSAVGVFYGVQTLRKSLPLANGEVSMPAANIIDRPRFAWRGMHLDVGRHFFSVEFVKKYLDIMALHNLNTFHWHLTEDQGWRIEIKKYPLLTQVGSKRKQSLLEDGSENGDGTPYGGYYTQEQIREIVKYAADRFITVIPEIDMPGHMMAALAAYPELGCTGGPYDVEYHYGVFKDVLCVGNPKSIQFAKDVLSEVMDLFPSHYIHIGGDECPRDRWKECEKCQNLVKSMGWKDEPGRSAESRLQSYFLSEMEKFVNARGRSIVGWDEIMEGGLTDKVTVMAWQNEMRGIQAAQQNHDVVMTPIAYLYLSNRGYAELEGTKGLRRVYEFEPAPDTLSESVRNHILGVQCCLWSEHILTTERAEYLVLPRIAALSEIAWCDRKNFDNFLTRLYPLTALYDRLHYTYQRHAFDVTPTFTVDSVHHNLALSLFALGNRPIYYTTDGNNPSSYTSIYKQPLTFVKSCLFKAQVINGSDTSRLYKENIEISKSSFCPVTLKDAPHQKYQGHGAITLCDGLRGTTNYNTDRWLGFIGKDMDLTIDLRSVQQVSSVVVSTDVYKSDAIFGATKMEVWSSDNGKDFTQVAEKNIPELTRDDRNGLYEHRLDFTSIQTRYLRVVVKGTPDLGEWTAWPHTPGFLFVDEVSVF